MKNHHTSSKMTAALLALLACTAVATAQVSSVVNTSVGTVGGVAGGLGGGIGAAGAGGTGFGSAGFGGAGAADGSGALGLGGATGGRIDAFESIGMRQARLAEQRAATQGTAGLNATSAVVPIANEHAASAVLTTGFSADTIRVASIDERDQLSTSINKRIDASADALASLKRESKSIDADSKAEFKAALKDVAAHEKQLKSSLKDARKSSVEAWTESRANVAARYEAYEQSVARAESVVAKHSRITTDASTNGSAQAVPPASASSANRAAAATNPNP